MQTSIKAPLSLLGKRENVTMNCNAQRVAKYALMQMNSEGTGMEIVAEYNTLTKEVKYLRSIRWPNEEVPADTPPCGYDNSKCPSR